MALFIGLFVFCLIWVILSVAFSIPIGWAFLILLGATAVVGAVIYFLRKLQKPQLKKVLTIAAIAVLIIASVFVLVKCTGKAIEDFNNGSGDPEWSTCLKCGGDGMEPSGAKCSRCNGVGRIPR